MLYAQQMHRSYQRATARMVRYADSDLTLDDLLLRLRRLGPSQGRQYARKLIELIDRDPGLRKRLALRDLAMLEAWRERADYAEQMHAAYAESLSQMIDAAAAQTDPDPSEEQKQAGNYRKGHCTLHGLDISIENAKGSERSGKGKDGKPWSVTMHCHYGYIKRTESEADGDHVDVFIGPNPESEIVFVIDQVTEGGKFDEHKCMLGFTNEADAKAGYLANYSPGWTGLGGIKALPLAAFKEWIHGDGTGKRIDEQRITYAEEMYQSWEVATFYAEWDESKHPRADDGKFGSGAGTGKTKKGTPERKAKIEQNKKTTQGGGLYQHGFEWSLKFRAILSNLTQNPGHEKTEKWVNEVRDKLAEAYKRAVNQRIWTIHEQVRGRFGVAGLDSPHFKEFMRATAPDRTPFEDTFKALTHDMAAVALGHAQSLKDYRHAMDERGKLRRLLNEHANKLSAASAQHADILDAAHKKLWAALSADSQSAKPGG